MTCSFFVSSPAMRSRLERVSNAEIKPKGIEGRWNIEIVGDRSVVIGLTVLIILEGLIRRVDSDT